MLAESLAALAAAGGAAVVQAATTDAWTELRDRVARWFGRGDGELERVQLERLDRSAAELVAGAGSEQERALQATVWRTRIEDLLESLPDDAERERAAAGLRALLEDTAAAGAISAGAGGVAAGRDVSVKAEGGSIAAAVLHGGAHIGPPPVPDPAQG
ncbi:hypothetical protein ACIQV3_32305 [Streptomyces sp. NPDC099050]|uniref:hypothetical protein n=1 Tax=Streptomyces sp. NPDC099050 TaxID=3366100 RepID=UPI00382D12ED